MNEVIRIDHGASDPRLAVLPEAKVGVAIRPGVAGDYGWIDAMQKPEKTALGFMFEGVIRGHIEKGHVLVAEAAKGVGCRMEDVGGEEEAGCRMEDVGQGSSATNPRPTTYNPQPTTSPAPPVPVGYLIGTDRYLKRDELGIIYQLNVLPAYRRSLVAANLLKAQFERSAYGCRLYCCWCAQDLKANAFWEAMGFVPLAFRTGGGRGKTKKDGKFRGRMHIFWQKRIRARKWDQQGGVWVEDDYPYWFPSLTGAGAIGEDRIVLPIPPGTHWSDAKPVVLPEGPGAGGGSGDGVDDDVMRLEAEVVRLEKQKRGMGKNQGVGNGEQGIGGKAEGVRPRPKRQIKSASMGGLYFGERPKSAEEIEAERIAAEAKSKADEAAGIEAALKEAKQKARRAKKKFDPAQEAFARELKDRWLEEVAARPGLLAAGRARYDVSRQIEATRTEQSGEPLALPGGDDRADAA